MLPCNLCFRGLLHVIWGYGGLLLFGHPHVFGCLPMCSTPSMHFHEPLYVCMFQGLSACAIGETPHMLGVWGASAHLSGFWCLSVHPLDVHYASSYTFLVVHYVSSLYCHSYDYYSSDCGVFWYVISFIGDHGFLFDGASYNIG